MIAIQALPSVDFTEISCALANIISYRMDDVKPLICLTV